jgi:dienelactone hydrolase
VPPGTQAVAHNRPANERQEQAVTAAQPRDDSDFERCDVAFGGIRKPVLKLGRSGPAVVVIHEIYGFTPTLARFCRWIAEAGFRVHAPILFGSPDTTNREKPSLGRVLGLCVAREINLFGSGRSSPVIEWLKPLCRQAHAECGGPGVGVVGMCLTGGFALSLAVDPVVLAPVLAQPGLPALSPAALDIGQADLGIVRERTRREGLVVRGYRFEGDALCRAARFQTLRRELGDGFAATVLPDSAANPQGPMAQAGKPPHSVFTGELVDAPGEPTRAAVDEVIAFLARRLHSRPA